MRARLWGLGLVVGAVLLTYSNALRGGFVGDDRIYVETNPFVREPGNLKLLVDPRFYRGTHQVLAGSRPVFLASLLVDRALWGGDPAGYHATNVLVHAANSAWVFALTAALGLPPPLPLWAGLLFGLHPIQTEAVNAISFRADLLAAFFSFFALWVYLRARGRPPARALLLLAASAGLFGLGLLSKEMAATVPLLAALAEIFFPVSKGLKLRAAGASLFFLLTACAYAGFWSARFRYPSVDGASSARAALGRLGAAMPTAPGAGTLKVGIEKGHLFLPESWEWSSLYADRKAWALTSVKSLAGELSLLVYPEPLVAERAPEPVRSLGEGGFVFCIAGLLLVAGYAVLMRRRDPPSAFGAAWCLVSILPVANVIPLYNPVAERYLYFVVAGAAWVAAAGVARLAASRSANLRRAALPAACVLAAACAVRARARNEDWRSERSLYFSAPAAAPQNAVAGFMRGTMLQDDGRPAEAAREFEEAVRRRPGYAEAWLGLGGAEAAAGDAARAGAAYDKAVESAPSDPIPRFAEAIFLTGSGRRREAAQLYREALALEPGYVEAWVNLGALYREQGRFREARDCYVKATSLAAPGDPVPFYSYGLLLEKLGDRRGAAAQFRRALARDSSFAPARAGLARAGAIEASRPH